MIVCYFYGPPLLLLARYSILPWFSTNHNAKKKEKKSKNCNQFSKFQVFSPFFFLSLNQVDNVFEVQNTSRSQRSCKEPNATTIVMFKGWLLKLWSIISHWRRLLLPLRGLIRHWRLLFCLRGLVTGRRLSRRRGVVGGVKPRGWGGDHHNLLRRPPLLHNHRRLISAAL